MHVCVCVCVCVVTLLSPVQYGTAEVVAGEIAGSYGLQEDLQHALMSLMDEFEGASDTK